MHAQNCLEQVILLEGEREVEGKITRLKPYDTTSIATGTPRRSYTTGQRRC